MSIPQNRLITQFIVFDTTFDNERALHSFNNLNEALEFIHMIKDNNARTYSLITGKNAETEFIDSNLINITVLMLVLTKSGICKESKKLLFDPSTNSFKNIDTNLFENINAKTNKKTKTISNIQNRIQTEFVSSNESIKPHIPITTKTHIPITLQAAQSRITSDKNIDFNQSQNNKSNDNFNDKKKEPDLFVELTKLYNTLMNVGEGETKSKGITDLNKIYDSIEEEALLDEEIRKTKDTLDAKLNKKSQKNNNDVVYDSDNTDYSDTDDTNDKHDLDILDNTSASVSTTDESNDLSKYGSSQPPVVLEQQASDPNELKELIDARNSLKQSIYKKELVITKANEKLNDELFLQRCKEQDERRAKQKHNEKISILESDKNTYLRMQSKIKKGTLKESNISPFFSYKYQIIKFMESNNLICLKKGGDIEKELHVFDQLNKIVDIFEKNSNDQNEENQGNNDEENKDPLDEIDDEYLPLCQIFMDNILENNDLIVTEKTIHTLLNNDPELKKKLFIDPANQSVFAKDSCAESYRNDEDDQMRKGIKNVKQTNKYGY